MGVCYIVGAGVCPVLDIEIKNGDFLIAADGGYRYCKQNNLIPDVVIGDFDSLGHIPDGDNIIKLNPVKDVTDMHAAAQVGIEKGFCEFAIYGATGGRIDHTLANVQLVASLSQKGYKTSLIDGKVIITALTDGSIYFDSSCSGYISVFSHTDKCEGVTISNMKYTLENGMLTNSFSLGVSNEFIGKDSRVTVEKGTAIIVFNKP